MSSSSGFLGNLPVLDAKNWDRWCIQMKVIFGYQEVLDVVENEISSLKENPSEAERKEYREAKKRDCKALFLLHQAVDDVHFQKISMAKTAHEVWKILEQCHSGGDKACQLESYFIGYMAISNKHHLQHQNGVFGKKMLQQ
ncbi:unnamed protein product [Cuscuta epithymum]|uniref:DUF4219 domain-containing protein n=1 Tax=Cuscuta epithymum TaxID=186058 RepID=A0AAV0D781_9ASTE|nr:unnamed protein product [Cuscuta epithymum]